MMATFDAQQYKQTTRTQWEEAAEAWHRWGPLLESWLGRATDLMLDAVAIDNGSTVLDVAAGAGGQSFAAARRVGPTGRVVATDISPAILEYAAKTAAENGLTNVETRELDGESLAELEAGSFDAVISRLGLIYFPDQRRALSGIRDALGTGGRVGAIVYSTADRNGFFAGPVSIIRKRAQLAPPAPGQPGPFSLGAPGVLEQALSEAGFRDITVQEVDAPVRLPSAADCVRFERESFGALHQMLSGVPEADREGVWSEIHDHLREYETAEGFVGPCQLLVVSGTA